MSQLAAECTPLYAFTPEVPLFPRYVLAARVRCQTRAAREQSRAAREQAASVRDVLQTVIFLSKASDC